MDLLKNFELKLAVRNGNLHVVKSLLSSGADVNFKLSPAHDSLLHQANDVEIVKELLLHGINVDVKNDFGVTPLNFAVQNEKRLEIIKELLKSGANVNTADDLNITPLLYEVHYSTDDKLDLINELLENGADINLKCPINGYHSALDIAVKKNKMACAKSLIRITLLKKFNANYLKIITLDRYRGRIQRKLSHFLKGCIDEIIRMKKRTVSNGSNLHEFVLRTTGVIKPLYGISEEEIFTDYPTYHDIILPKLKPCLERGRLFDKLKHIQIFSKPNIYKCKQTSVEEVVLNNDCVYKIAVLLSNNDLLKFLKAAQNSNYGQSSCKSLRARKLNSHSENYLGKCVKFCNKRMKLCFSE